MNNVINNPTKIDANNHKRGLRLFTGLNMDETTLELESLDSRLGDDGDSGVGYLGYLEIEDVRIRIRAFGLEFQARNSSESSPF
jgi:hypothetical protein